MGRCALPLAGILLLIGGMKAEAQEWTVSREPFLEIGAREHLPGHVLYRVKEVFPLPRGEWGLIDGGSLELRVFDGQGGLKRTFGGSGPGPTELRSIFHASWIPPDTILIHDRTAGRVVLMNAAQGYVTSVPVRAPPGIRWPSAAGVALDGDAILVNGQVFERGELEYGIVRPPFELLRLRRSGEWSPKIIDVPGSQFLVGSDPPLTTVLPFGDVTIVRSRGDVLAILRTQSGEVSLLNADGSVVATMTVDGDPANVTRRELDDYAAQLARQQPDGPSEQQWAQLFSQADIPDKHPKAADIVLGVDEEAGLEVWVGRGKSASEGGREWQVFDCSGRPLSRLTLPPDMSVLRVEGKALIGVSRNELDVEVVKVFRLTRATPATREPGSEDAQPCQGFRPTSSASSLHFQ